ncbi:hypothetical protein ACO22_08153 [Paracoccidioides brasiliensis]|uniref:Glucose-methanol-choline oxidoreductase C-terminal domain-containing protein n=1 Tax=Paracoccidioides brasiliensis TaxID=121759 RepID=A0A1D2J2N1_PARBR|nr:hypothetical protein ACO22_08153 [Paracoccidioides brasiliensis]
MVLSVVFLIYTGRRSHQLSKSGGPPPNQSQISPIDLDLKVTMENCKTVRKFWATKPASQQAGLFCKSWLPVYNTIPLNATDAHTANTTPTRHSTDDAAGSGWGGRRQAEVYGTKNVRVIDASVMPYQVGGHLTSTLCAIAKRAVESIKQGFLNGCLCTYRYIYRLI